MDIQKLIDSKNKIMALQELSNQPLDFLMECFNRQQILVESFGISSMEYWQIVRGSVNENPNMVAEMIEANKEHQPSKEAIEVGKDFILQLTALIDAKIILHSKDNN